MSASSITISPRATLQPVTIQLPASKSECNRALIIQALCQPRPTVHNISEARDTQTMLRLLQSQDFELNVLDAGTTMRFLLAYCAVSGRESLLTGTPRMQERPIGPLGDALLQLGAPLTYMVKEGYPPIKIGSDFKQQTNQLSIRSDISSQFISALLMIAPVLPQGLELTLVGAISSRPYIQMTLDLMEHFGARWQWESNTISIAAGGYKPNEYSIEGDWSGASYWFSLVALADEAEIFLPNLRQNSLQGDKRIIEIMEKLGVGTRWEKEGVRLFKIEAQSSIEQDFDDCPDLAQTVAVCCAAKGIPGRFTGLKSLRIKETDRIAALQQELAKIGARLEEEAPGTCRLIPSESLPKQVSIHTYDDHRMAMAFMPLATKMQVSLDDPSVVNKSFPRFWEQTERAGFSLMSE